MAKERKTTFRNNPFQEGTAVTGSDAPVVPSSGLEQAVGEVTQEAAPVVQQESVRDSRTANTEAADLASLDNNQEIPSLDVKMAEKPKDFEDLSTPAGVQKRLGKQQKKHDRELNEMRAFMQSQADALQKSQAMMEQYNRMMQDAKRSPQVAQQPSQQPVWNQYTNSYEWPQQQPSTNYYSQPTGQMVGVNQGAIDPESIVNATAEKLRKENEVAIQANQKQQRMAEEQAHMNEFFGSLDEAANQYEDFDDVVRNNALPIDKDLAEAASFLPGKLAADAFYYLGKNQQELNRINQLPKLRRIKEFVQVAVGLAENKKVRQGSNAPPPTAIRQSVASGSSVKQADPGKMTYAEIKALNRARYRK